MLACCALLLSNKEGHGAHSTKGKCERVTQTTREGKKRQHQKPKTFPPRKQQLISWQETDWGSWVKTNVGELGFELCICLTPFLLTAPTRANRERATERHAILVCSSAVCINLGGRAIRPGVFSAGLWATNNPRQQSKAKSKAKALDYFFICVCVLDLE